MPIRHVLLAVSVAVIWGANFIAIHESLQQFPPLFLVALRFGIIAIPTLAFIPRPQVKTRWLIRYGLGFGTLQFIGLYLGMAAGFPSGLAGLAGAAFFSLGLDMGCMRLDVLKDIQALPFNCLIL